MTQATTPAAAPVDAMATVTPQNVADIVKASTSDTAVVDVRAKDVRMLRGRFSFQSRRSLCFCCCYMHSDSVELPRHSNNASFDEPAPAGHNAAFAVKMFC